MSEIKRFDIAGPIEVKMMGGRRSRLVGSDSLSSFFEDHPEIAKARGCYVFAVRAGRGITPIYVGKATKSFGQECFADHKLKHYNEGLLDYQKGSPVLFFVTEPISRGRTNAKAIDEIEKYLIVLAAAANENLRNNHKRSRERWGIRGLIRSGKGRTGEAHAKFRGMLNL